MKNKKTIVYVCVIGILILGIICFLVLKNVNSKNSVSENLVNNETDSENLASQAQENLENENLSNVITSEETSNLEGKIVASDGFEFDEKDLKEKIGIYLIYENFMQDYYEPEKELENANIVDYSNEAKVFIGYFLSSYLNENPTEEQVRKAVEEFCGEHYENYIDTTEYWIAYDGDNSYEFVQAGDYNPSGYCNSIESIVNDNGKYIVTFTYSRPSEQDYIDNNLDNIQKYRKQFTFIYHPDAEYTKYQLTELSFLKGETL